MIAPAILHPDAIELLQALDQSEPGSVAKLVHLFAADAPMLLSRIELGSERGDLAEINQAAHFLRSSALALGATELASAAFGLEHLTPEQLGAEAERQLTQLRGSLRSALLSLLEWSSEA